MRLAKRRVVSWVRIGDTEDHEKLKESISEALIQGKLKSQIFTLHYSILLFINWVKKDDTRDRRNVRRQQEANCHV